MIVCIEGADRTGKSTIVRGLIDELANRGWMTSGYELPTPGRLRSLIYRMLDSGYARKFPIAFQLLQHLSKLKLQYVLPYDVNEIIVLGRWSMSSQIYGKLEGVPQWILNLMVKSLLKPDVTFVIEGKVGERSSNDEYENDDEMQRNVANAYLLAARHDTSVIVMVNDQQGPKVMINKIADRIVQLANAKEKSGAKFLQDL